jgi:hypothetical protein
MQLATKNAVHKAVIITLTRMNSGLLQTGCGTLCLAMPSVNGLPKANKGRPTLGRNATAGHPERMGLNGTFDWHGATRPGYLYTGWTAGTVRSWHCGGVTASPLDPLT